MKSSNVFSFSKPLNWTENQTVSETIRQTQILSLLRTRSISAHYIAGSKGISSCYYGSFVCSDTSVIGNNFWPLPSSEQIRLVLTDYYILENNSLLKATLKYKRIQLTDFRTVPMEHFGENEDLFLCFYGESQINWCSSFHLKSSVLVFLQIYPCRSPTHQTSLTPVTTDCCCWCMYHRMCQKCLPQDQYVLVLTENDISQRTSAWCFHPAAI